MDHQFRRKYNRLKLEVCLSITLLIMFIIVAAESNPTFTVESTAVKAYNLTSDNHFFCIINLGIRAHNPLNASYDFKNINMEVRKGKHHKLADDAVPSFTLGPIGDLLIRVEAVGLRVDLRREIAAEVWADSAAGEGRVNVFMNGGVGKSDDFRVTCKNVMVDFLGSTVKVEKVECEVRADRPSRGDPAPTSMPWTWSASTPSPTNGIRY